MKNSYDECTNCPAKKQCKILAGELKKDWHDKCHKKAMLYAGLKFCEIPPRYHFANIHNYEIDDDTKPVYEIIKPYIDNIEEEVNKGLNLFFYGETPGTGKTFHGMMLLNHYLYKNCNVIKIYDSEIPPALYVVYPQLIDRLRNFKDDWQTKDMLEKVNNTPILLLDDVGAGIMSEYSREQTYIILNHRYNNKLSTIVTSNFSLSQINSENLLGNRIVSRLTSNFDGYEFEGIDRRRSFR